MVIIIGSKIVTQQESILITCIRHYFICLLAVLIASQSIVAIADTHSHPQSGKGYSEHSHSGYLDNEESSSTQEISKELTPSIYDCHHAGHCHGHTVAVLSATIPGLIMLHSKQTLPSYIANLTSGIPPSLFRPPIA